METPTLPDTPKRKSSQIVLFWIALIVLCLFVFMVSMGLMGLVGWKFYSLTRQAREESEIPQFGPMQLPQIKPEDGKLVFASPQAKYRNRHISTILTDGSGLTQLTDGTGDDYAPRWSPDGKKVAFVSRRDGNPEIYVMDADGKNVIRLTYDPARDDSLDWSPDGEQILFSSNRDGNYNLYLMSAEGEKAGLSQLTDTPFDELDPSISPDGTQILFMEDENGTYKLSMVGIDGKTEKASYRCRGCSGL